MVLHNPCPLRCINNLPCKDQSKLAFKREKKAFLVQSCISILKSNQSTYSYLQSAKVNKIRTTIETPKKRKREATEEEELDEELSRLTKEVQEFGWSIEFNRSWK